MLVKWKQKPSVIREVLEGTWSSSARSGQVSAARRGPLAQVENARRERSVASGTRVMRVELERAAYLALGPERRFILETADKADGVRA